MTNSFLFFRGDYGDIYGAHPAANAMGNSVPATVNNSLAIFYNIAGLGRQSEGDLLTFLSDNRKLEKDSGGGKSKPK